MHLCKGRVSWILSAVLLFTASIACAQEKGSKHSLWKVQGKTNAVYLFGSIHFLKTNFYPLPKPIEDAYKRSGVVMFEADFAEMATSQAKFMEAGMLPAGEKLAQHVSPETYGLLQSYLREHVGMPT